jgi:type VI secretion system secreted protein VgrG
MLVQFEVQPATEVLRPVASQSKPKTGGPETALVVGPSADTAESNIYTDNLGRIKVQFPWDRYGQNNQNSSCWLRVSSTWAGNQLGAMHLPRIGEEVLVEFLGGDPDMPMAAGRVYNQVNMPPWSLPEQQALSGFRSRELIPGGGNSAAGRSNHLILDDTEQKIQVQLKSDHQHSQLSLGHITKIEDNAGRKDPRGEGFDLRTDGHGVLRAQDGMLISTEARRNAQAHAKDMGETTSRLQQAQGQHDALGDLAKQHQAQDATDQGDVAKAIQAQNDAVQGKSGAEGKFPELAEPHIAIASPAGIESTTPGNTQQHSGKHHAITSGAHTSISSNKSLLVVAKDAVRMFAYKSGMKLISASSDVNITALKTSIHVLAKTDITLTTNTIALIAKKQVLVNGGGSYMQWSAGSIEEGTAGTRVAHAGTHPVAGPKNEPPVPIAWPGVKGDDRFQVFYPDGSPVVGAKYRATLESGEVITGLTDAQGQTQLLKSALIGRYTIDVFPVAA